MIYCIRTNTQPNSVSSRNKYTKDAHATYYTHIASHSNFCVYTVTPRRGKSYCKRRNILLKHSTQTQYAQHIREQKCFVRWLDGNRITTRAVPFGVLPLPDACVMSARARGIRRGMRAFCLDITSRDRDCSSSPMCVKCLCDARVCVFTEANRRTTHE